MSSSRESDNAAKETNIQVVVRVRPRNNREKRDNSQTIISTSGVKGKELYVKTSPSDSSSATKTYTFDKVFGPEADQELLFRDVVVPTINEVLMGYNCTIFAYGQTGTGKTYTMSGDLEDINGPHAGVIPRTLYTLFETLEREKAEFSVRVSYIELYNEELKDLLSAEDDFRKLRVFEDLNRKGSVVIQGLEEIVVKNATDVIAILQKGAKKRQIAATNFNEQSSRSHSVFSITVHTKEEVNGEDLLKIGKMYLVDLAGSENIGRSGAENKRAREAGMINQSLLTLGRVINALVERSPHIPYRESKLTRLLQDSLGGRTKTCIIATVSPAKCNTEESLSTLDYAHRAKNIRNKPEVNQRMTKRVLIKEYANEIERLKLDLTAAREKNGIFLSDESYNLLMEQNQSRKDRIEELAKEMLAKEELLGIAQERLDETLKSLGQTRKELSGTKNELLETTNSLNQTQDDLREKKQGLLEQTALTKAHANTERNLDQLASTLVSTLTRSVDELSRLHAKVDYKNQVENANRELFDHFRSELLKESAGVTNFISSFKDSHVGTIDQFKTKLVKFLELQTHEYGTRRTTLSQQNSHASTLVDQLDSSVNLHIDAVNNQMSMLNENAHGFVQGYRDLEASFGANFAGECESVLRALNQHNEQIELWHQKMTGFVQKTFTLLQSHSELQGRMVADLSSAISNFVETETATSQNHIQFLEETLVKRRQEEQAQREFLVQEVSRLVSDFSHRRSQEYEGMINVSRDRECSNTQRLRESSQTWAQNISSLDRHRETSNVELATESQSLCQLNEEAKEVFQNNTNLMKANTESIVSLYQANANNRVDRVSAHIDSLSSNAQDVQAKNAAFQSSYQEKINQTRQQVQTAFDLVEEFMVTSVETLGAETQNWTNELAQIEGQVNEMNSTVSEKIQVTQSEIQQKQLQVDFPTGTTPKKQHVEFPTSWGLTESHDFIVSKLREKQALLLSQGITDENALFASDVEDNENIAPLSPSKNYGVAIGESKLPRPHVAKRKREDGDIEENESDVNVLSIAPAAN